MGTFVCFPGWCVVHIKLITKLLRTTWPSQTFHQQDGRFSESVDVFLREARPLKTRAEFPSEEEVFPFLGKNHQSMVQNRGIHWKPLRFLMICDFWCGAWAPIEQCESVNVSWFVSIGRILYTRFQRSHGRRISRWISKEPWEPLYLP